MNSNRSYYAILLYNAGFSLFSVLTPMDIELARTFLEIVRTGSFMAAAERLHVTQTAVTARIQNLEGQLGCRLFVRNRSGAHLTEHGERFSLHASQLVQTWEAARRELPLPEGAADVLVLGAELSLWNPLLLDWLSRLRAAEPELAVRAEAGERLALHEQLRHGVLDALLAHQPDYWPGLQVEQLLEEKLVMVETVDRSGPYVQVDWGEAFRRQLDTALPGRSRSAVTLNLGPLALHYLLRNGGSGYFRSRVVEPHLHQGRLARVADAPEFSWPVYLVYPRGSTRQALHLALAALREAVEHRSPWAL